MRKLTIATFALITGFSTLALAQDELRQRQVRACTGDAFRLCSAAIPDEGQIAVCMAAKRAQLSQPCRAVFDLGRAER